MICGRIFFSCFGCLMNSPPVAAAIEHRSKQKPWSALYFILPPSSFILSFPSAMFGEVFTCPSCEFEFCTGWSHHAGGQFLICRECATRYLAGEGVSPWGAKCGAQLKLLRYVYVKRRRGWEYQDTGIVLTVGERNLSEEASVFLYFDGENLSHLSCPACSKAGSLVGTLNVGDRCPRCRAGIFGEPDTCIY